MQHARELVVHLTGPRKTWDRLEKSTGISDVSRVRLKPAFALAHERNCLLYSPIKESEKEDHESDLREVARRAPFILQNNPEFELGSAHTLANAWMANRYAYFHKRSLVWLVTSEWHGERALEAFRGIAQANEQRLQWKVDVKLVVAPFSENQIVRRYEREMMEEQEKWKRKDERVRVEEYVQWVASEPLVNDFLAEPDSLPFKWRTGRIYQSVVERNKSQATV